MEYNNFYITRYNKFIASCKFPDNETYYEMHHIVPKCIGGTDDPDNLIKLTARQHFIAHWMLWKAYMTRGLAYAFFLMTVANKNHSGRTGKINSKTYSLLKLHKSQHHSVLNTERWKNEEWAAKQRVIMSKAASTPEEKQRRSANATKFNEIYKEEKSQSHKKRWQDPVWVANVKQQMVNNHPRTRAILVDGVEYAKAEHVATQFNISKTTVRDRIKSNSATFAGWSYK